MKKFAFKLEPLYDYRQRLEEICKKEFGSAHRRLDDEELKLKALREAYGSSSGELDRMKEKGSCMEDVTMYCQYLMEIKRHIAAQEKAIAECRKALEAKRAELAEASKSKKAVEIMKEKSISSYYEEFNRQEQKLADDMAVSRFGRGAGYEK